MNKRGRMVMKDASGVTVVDLLITIMIIGILAAVTAPQLRGLLKSYQVTGATRLIWVDLQRARMLAIKENGTIRVDFTTSTSYSIKRDATGVVVVSRNLSSNYPGITIDVTGNSVSFGSTGIVPSSVPSSSQLVQVKGPSGSKKSFTVTATGRIGSIS
jgi:Tfp pilus assembly protein FimT